MKDAIAFLGTAGDAIVAGKQLRASGGIVVVAENNQFHIDPGPGALVRCKQFDLNPRETIALLVSHSHLNHCSEANAVISAMTYNGMDKRGIFIAPQKVFDNGVGEFFQGCVERSVVLKEDSKIGVNEVDIEPLPCKHFDTGCMGFRFTAPSFTMAYTSDTQYTKALAQACSEADILIANCKYPAGMKMQGHMNAEEVAILFSEAKPKLGIITHFGIKALQEDPINISRYIQKESDVQVMAAKDGMVMSPTTFASRVRQKKLQSYR
ncbi:MBL fold metallo-hydrolase [Nanoarchaeota archaeon]